MRWRAIPRNAKVVNDNGTHVYDLNITKVNIDNKGWYGCRGTLSDVNFLGMGYLDVKGK